MVVDVDVALEVVDNDDLHSVNTSNGVKDRKLLSVCTSSSLSLSLAVAADASNSRVVFRGDTA